MHVLTRTREASGPSDTSYRVAKRASDRSLARHPRLQIVLRQGCVAKERKSVPLTGLRSGLRPGLARLPCPQVLQWHPRVAKGACGRSSARGPCPQVPQCHSRVAKGTSGRSSARGPCPQVLQWHPRMAKRASDRSSARLPCPQVPQRHPGVATGSSGRSSARPAVSIFGERGNTLRPARTSAYSAPGNTPHPHGPRHIQRVPGVSVALVDVAGWTPGIFIERPGISRARRRRGCRLCPSHRRGCCRSGWRGWSG